MPYLGQNGRVKKGEGWQEGGSANANREETLPEITLPPEGARHEP